MSGVKCVRDAVAKESERVKRADRGGRRGLAGPGLTHINAEDLANMSS